MKHMIADILMRYGVTREEYDKCLPQILRNNKIMLGILNGVLGLCFLILVLWDRDDDYLKLRIVVGIVALLICFLICTKGEKHPAFMRCALYLTLVIILAAAGYQGAFLNIDKYCTFFLLTLAAFPVFLMDRPGTFCAFLITAAGGYIYCAWQVKPENIAYGDTCNVIFALLWGVIAFYALGSFRVRGMIDRVQLGERDRQNEELIGNTPVGICMMQMDRDNELHLSYCSPGFLEMSRMSQPEADKLYKGSAYEALHPDDREWVREIIEQHTDEAAFSINDFRLLTGTGDYIWISVVLRRKALVSEVKSYYVVCTDVTKEHELRAQLSDSQKRFDIALDNSDLHIWEYDLLNNRCINSEKAGKVYGATRVMENFPECLLDEGKADEQSMAIYLDMKKQLLAGNSNVKADVRLRDAKGKWHWRRIEYQLEKDADGKPI
ncbi:MAG: PAS domain S-box protein [Clostridia bacterium]|nr:PAS domain S-box protein [Clostridia bacterium]NCD03898.1 PAS domain S-box protein [Clostridia bacterium]